MGCEKNRGHGGGESGYGDSCGESRGGQGKGQRRSKSLYGIGTIFVCLVVHILMRRSSTWTSTAEQVKEGSGAHSSQNFSVETIGISESERESLERLGLTARNPVKIWTPESGDQVVHGRFLHITDIHPDELYREGADASLACHRGKGDAGKYGDPVSGCDSPMLLMNKTLEWVSANLKDKIDFIVWTGDNMRHDNDRRYPRYEGSILEMNQLLSDIMYDTFQNDDKQNLRKMKVDLIPSLGNNDVYPHNLFAPGPTLQTREFFKIWHQYVPQSQLHIFNRGAYFFKEIIPNKLAVMSINTLYLFRSNPLVDNCDRKKDPGYKLFEWLGYVLKEIRTRKMKVWLTGHVPPNEKNYDVSCLRKYILWTHEYRDVIIGGLFGHMNLDHFIPLDSVAAYNSLGKVTGDEKINYLQYDTSDSSCLKEHDFASIMGEIRVQGGVPYGKVEYMDSVRKDSYATLKGKSKAGEASERYSIVKVAASVIPTYNPGLTVWEYNITGLEESLKGTVFSPWDEFFEGLSTMINLSDNAADGDDDDDVSIAKDKSFPSPMPKDLPLGPAYVPQTFTPERYVQYYADLKAINKGEKEFAFEIEYSTDDPLYGLKYLTVDEWIKYGRKLGEPVKHKKKSDVQKPDKKLEKIWKEYLKNSFVSTNYEHMNL